MFRMIGASERKAQIDHHKSVASENTVRTARLASIQQRRGGCFHFDRKRALQARRIGDVDWLWDSRETSAVSLPAGKKHSTRAIRGVSILSGSPERVFLRRA